MQTCTAMQRTAEPILLVGGLGIWQSFTSRSSEKLYTTGTSYPHTCIARYLLPTCKFSPVMMISCVVTPTSTDNNTSTSGVPCSYCYYRSTLVWTGNK